VSVVLYSHIRYHWNKHCLNDRKSIRGNQKANEVRMPERRRQKKVEDRLEQRSTKVSMTQQPENARRRVQVPIVDGHW
jgi:hypothetical protein